nr:piggyBac transposable element-derived protein 3-like [Onthophagus taurus]
MVTETIPPADLQSEDLSVYVSQQIENSSSITVRPARRLTRSRYSTSELSTSPDDTDDSDLEEETWKKTYWTSRPVAEDFDKIPLTTKQSFNPKTRPIRFFEKFFTNEAIELIVSQTNLYADQMKIKEWTPVTTDEIKAFLGILIIMGYKVLPMIDLYWSSDPGFRENDIAEIMPVKRFKKIMRSLHLNDNARQPERNSPEYDRLFKLRPLINIINESCKNNVNLSSSQSIDESMVLFKGRSSLKQYLPLKPIKRGYKIWCRCDSETGYLYEFSIYTGKTDGVEKGLGAKVVKNLTQHLIDNNIKNVHVTFDNFFTDNKLLEYLYEHNIYATGTVRRHREGLPQLTKGPNARKLKLSKGEFKWRVKDNVAFIIWQDNKEVLLLSSAFHPKVGVCTTLRTQKDGSKVPIRCPLAIKQYTKRMG